MDREAIARNLMEMSDLKVPITAIIIGEGGSGGGSGSSSHRPCADAGENSIYAILSPERLCFHSLWKGMVVSCHGSSRSDENHLT